MHKFINNSDITRKNLGQIRKTTGTKSETTGTIIVPVVNMLKYALRSTWRMNCNLNLWFYIMRCNWLKKHLLEFIRVVLSSGRSSHTNKIIRLHQLKCYLWVRLPPSWGGIESRCSNRWLATGLSKHFRATTFLVQLDITWRGATQFVPVMLKRCNSVRPCDVEEVQLSSSLWCWRSATQFVLVMSKRCNSVRPCYVEDVQLSLSLWCWRDATQFVPVMLKKCNSVCPCDIEEVQLSSSLWCWRGATQFVPVMLKRCNSVRPCDVEEVQLSSSLWCWRCATQFVPVMLKRNPWMKEAWFNDLFDIEPV